MKHLPTNKAGYVVPWFVAWIDGEPDFRVIRSGGIAEAYNNELCWLCGQKRGRYGAFVIGPMCAVNRVSAEPPSHRECATYAARVCPFLSNPNMHRRERGIPEDKVDPAGMAILRNPGVALVWVARGGRGAGAWRPFSVPSQVPGANPGVLFDVGDPVDVEWWAEGRSATRAEVEESIRTGLPTLVEKAGEEGPEAVKELAAMASRAMKLLPPDLEGAAR